MVVDPKPGDLPMSRGEVQVTLNGGPNPRTLKSAGDEVWVGVKCQSNLEIAGSLRNSFRASLKVRVLEVEH